MVATPASSRALNFGFAMHALQRATEDASASTLWLGTHFAPIAFLGHNLNYPASAQRLRRQLGDPAYPANSHHGKKPR